MIVDCVKLDEFCDLVKQTRNQYTQNLSESFSSSDPSSYFNLREEGANLNFVWSKEINKGIKVSTYTLNDILDHLRIFLLTTFI